MSLQKLDLSKVFSWMIGKNLLKDIRGLIKIDTNKKIDALLLSK